MGRAVHYAQEVSENKQFNRRKFSDPYVVGALLALGNCLSLVEDNSLTLLSDAYQAFANRTAELGIEMPINEKEVRLLDCAIIEFLHSMRESENKPPFDTVRCAFSEGGPVFPGSGIAARLHIQVCVRNTNMIRAYFLPQPSRG